MIKLILHAAVEISGCHLELRAAPFNFPYKKELFSGNRREYLVFSYPPTVLFWGLFPLQKGFPPTYGSTDGSTYGSIRDVTYVTDQFASFLKKIVFFLNFVAIVPRCNCIRSPLMDDNIRIVVLRYYI